MRPGTGDDNTKTFMGGTGTTNDELEEEAI